MAEPGQSQTASQPAGFRFSLRALFFFLFVAGLAFSHLVASWRLNDATERICLLNQENLKLRRKLGYLDIEDPDKLCAAASPQFMLEDLRWRWQTYVPRAGFRLHAALNAIPVDGMPDSRATVRQIKLPRGEITLDAAIRQDHSGQWELVVSVPSTDGSASEFMIVQIPEAYVGWLAPGKSGGGMYSSYRSVATGEPLVLIRYRRPKKFPD